MHEAARPVNETRSRTLGKVTHRTEALTIGRPGLTTFAEACVQRLILDIRVCSVRPASPRPGLMPVVGFNNDGLGDGLGLDGTGHPQWRLLHRRESVVKAKGQF
jgi:hypothetical protein